MAFREQSLSKLTWPPNSRFYDTKCTDAAFENYHIFDGWSLLDASNPTKILSLVRPPSFWQYQDFESAFLGYDFFTGVCLNSKNWVKILPSYFPSTLCHSIGSWWKKMDKWWHKILPVSCHIREPPSSAVFTRLTPCHHFQLNFWGFDTVEKIYQPPLSFGKREILLTRLVADAQGWIIGAAHNRAWASWKILTWDSLKVTASCPLVLWKWNMYFLIWWEGTDEYTVYCRGADAVY